MPEPAPEPEDTTDAAETAAEAAHMRGLSHDDLLVYAENELYDQDEFRPGCDELLRRGLALPDVEPAPPSTPEDRRRWASDRRADFKPIVHPPGWIDDWVPGPGDIDLREQAAQLRRG